MSKLSEQLVNDFKAEMSNMGHYTFHMGAHHNLQVDGPKTFSIVSQHFASGEFVNDSEIQGSFFVDFPLNVAPGDEVIFEVDGNQVPVVVPTVQATQPPGGPVTATPPSNRQLVAYENNPANPDYRRLVAIPPGQAKGIGLPAFDVASGKPNVGSVVGEGHYDVSTGVGWVWDGSHMQPITPPHDHPLHQWDAAMHYVKGDMVLHKHGLYEATGHTPNVGVEPELWHDYGSTITQLEWNFVGVIPLVIQPGALPDGDHYIKFEKTTTPVEGVFTLSSVNRALGNWQNSVVYHKNDVVLYHHALYQSIAPANQGNQPAKHDDSTEWLMLGYVPDPPKQQPNNGDGLIWDSATDGFKFFSPTAFQTNRQGKRESGQQSIVNLATPPEHYFNCKFTVLLSHSADNATYINPLLIMQVNGAWVDPIGGGGAMMFGMAENPQANMHWFNRQQDSATWKSDRSGMPTLPNQINFNIRADRGYIQTVEGHKVDADWWEVIVSTNGTFWGNDGGWAQISFLMKPSNIENMTSIGTKFTNGKNDNDFIVTCEWK